MNFRLRDILIASTLLVLMAPLMGMIMLLLWATQGKVFFLQKRPGYRGKPFTLYKFSTLYDADPGEDEAANQVARQTVVGRYLRRWSLDELPQLINVLKGEMSLVGPRPLLMEYWDLYTDEERKRHDVLPGITGWAQVNGRNTLRFKERFEYDLWYVEHRSICLDWQILRMTLGRIVRRDGVYAGAETTSPRFDGTN